MTSVKIKQVDNNEDFLLTVERLKVLLPHWDKHNDEHIAQMEIWHKKVIKQELPELAESIEQAIFHMIKTGLYLSQALDDLNNSI